MPFQSVQDWPQNLFYLRLMKPTNYHKPSIKTLMRDLRVTSEMATRLRAIMAGEVRITGNLDFPATNRWIDACYHKPRRLDLILSAMDETFETFGVEPLRNRDGDCVAEYLNTGDSYAPTILFLHETRAFRVSSWGDFVETNERRYSLR